MKAEFNQIIERLLRDQYFAVTVEHKDDFDMWQCIERNASAVALEQKYGSVAAFFEKLHASGSNELRLSPKKQNGSDPKKNRINYKPSGEPIVIRMKAKTTEAASPAPVVYPVQPDPVIPVPVPALAAPALGGAHLTGDAAYKYFDHSRLMSENQRLQTENDRLKKDNDDLKDTIRENKYSAEKTKSNNELIVGLGNILTPVIQRAMPMADASPGLGQPDPSLSPIKAQFVEAIKRTDDNFVHDIALVAKGMNDMPEFDDEINALLKKYNLIPAAHAS